MRRKNSEDSEQATLIKWAALIRIPGSNERVIDYLIHIPNGGNRNAIEGAKFKRMGVKPGVSDLFLAYPSGTIHGLWIELKKTRNAFSTPAIAALAVSEHQKNWLRRMNEVGYLACVCYGADEAMSRIKSYLGIPTTEK